MQEAKTHLAKFLGDTVLTFTIRKHTNGEWIAQCNEIPAIMTGGMGDDIAIMDKMIRDAILTAAGLDSEYSGTLLKFVAYDPKPSIESTFSRDREAEYVLA